MKALGLLSLFVLMNCGGSSGGGKKENATPQVEELRGLSTSLMDSGNFLSDCKISKEEGNSKISLGFKKDMQGKITTTVIYNYYLDTNCNDHSYMRIMAQGKGYASQDNRMVELLFNRVELTLLLQQIVDNFNNERACGITDWAIWSASNVMDTECGPDSGSSGFIFLDAITTTKIEAYLCDRNILNSECEKYSLMIDPRL